MTPADVLVEIEAMSRENDTDRTTRAAPWTAAPWTAAVKRLTRRAGGPQVLGAALDLLRGRDATDEERAALVDEYERRTRAEADARLMAEESPPVYDGDRPLSPPGASMWQQSGWPQQLRNGRAMPSDALALDAREIAQSGAMRSVLAMHRPLHRALAGETYDQRYERIKAEGGVIREIRATEATTAPLIAGCPHCARCER